MDFMIWPLIVFIVVAALIVPVRALAPRLGLVDAPGGRKEHVGDVPLIGGVVAFPVFIVCSILAGEAFAQAWPLYAAIMVLLVTGAVDDRVHIHPFIKFGMQFLAAALVVLPGGAVLYDLGDLFGMGVFELGFMALPFSIVAVVLLINAINLMDGLDGLAGGIGFVILGWMLFAALSGGSSFALSIALLMAALAGFLVYNMRSPWRGKASIFMGDAGSMSLGLMVGWYAIHLSPEGARMVEPMAVAWVLAVPIWDECAQFYRRVSEGRHPFSPDRGHLHHNVLAAGFTDGRAVMLIIALVFVFGAIGVVGAKMGVPLIVLTVVWIVGILAHMAYAKDLARYPRLLTRLFKPKG